MKENGMINLTSLKFIWSEYYQKIVISVWFILIRYCIVYYFITLCIDVSLWGRRVCVGCVTYFLSYKNYIILVVFCKKSCKLFFMIYLLFIIWQLVVFDQVFWFSLIFCVELGSIKFWKGYMCYFCYWLVLCWCYFNDFIWGFDKFFLYVGFL